MKAGCNRCQYTWEGEEVYCPMCGELFTHVEMTEQLTKEEFIKRYGFDPDIYHLIEEDIKKEP